MEVVAASSKNKADSIFVSRRSVSRRSVAKTISSPLEERFIQNWSALARAFGMDPDMGRVHAVTYLSESPATCSEVAAKLNMGPVECQKYLDELCGWNVVTINGEGYEAEQDPWKWFVSILRQRAKRELLPILSSLQQLTEMSSSLECPERSKRISRFAGFVDQLSSMLETLGSLNAGPMGGLMRTVSRFVPRI